MAEVCASQIPNINSAQNERIRSFLLVLGHLRCFSGLSGLFSIILFKSDPIWSKDYVDFHDWDTFQGQIVAERFRTVSTDVRWFSDFISVQFITRDPLGDNTTSQVS